MTNEDKSDADILADAREYIEKHGWWRGSLVGPNGRQVCGMGAVAASQGWLEPDQVQGVHVVPIRVGRVQRIVTQVVRAATANENSVDWDFIHWNDEVAKDKQEVLDAFAKAEKIERAGFDPDEGAW